MIIARIISSDGTFLFHGSVEIQGSPKGDDYRMGGWFPIDSFNFGMEKPPDPDSKKDGQPTPNTPAARGAPATKSPTAPQGQAGKDKPKRSEMTLAKEVDRATCDLMLLAMQHRSHKGGPKAAGDKEYHVDVHVLSSVRFGTKEERNIFPSLMIHLEAVRVAAWGVNGSGDARPTESVTLEYDKGAMHYSWYNGETFIHFGPRGWDQDKNEVWPEDKMKWAYKEYRPSG
jgi:hypothetical protein